MQIPLPLPAFPGTRASLWGPKPPLQPKHVWAIRTHLQVMRKVRDLALFNLAIDSKLRGCDVVSLKVEDVAPDGYTIERATIRRKRQAAPSGLKLPSKRARRSMNIFASRKGNPAASCSAAARGKEAASPQANTPACFQLHVHGRTSCEPFRHAFLATDQGDHNLPQDRKSPCRTATSRPHQGRETVRYLGIEVDDALAIAEQVDIESWGGSENAPSGAQTLGQLRWFVTDRHAATRTQRALEHRLCSFNARLLRMRRWIFF